MDSESCTDAIQNQDEMGIDCGGTCPESCGTGRSNIFTTQDVKNMIHLLYLLHQHTIHI